MKEARNKRQEKRSKKQDKMRRHNFKKLQIWIDSMDLVDENYKITNELPGSEKFGLRSQMNRCAVSIVSNISEGSSKNTDLHFLKYLSDSLGSAFEWETQLIICFRQGFITEKEFKTSEKKIIMIQKKISSFMDSLNKKS